MIEENNISKYINDELDHNEVKEFEKKMNCDPMLATKVESLLNLKSKREKSTNSVHKKDALEVLPEQFLKGISQTDFGEKKTIRMVSAIFLIIITALIFLGYLLKT
mgnify:CR=1 FL=1|tara:strand:+ start:239 stop:556 length:318 start_codon:yes stop_codon:yes gene_type:complete